MSDVMTVLAKEASDKAMEIARLRAENDRLGESVKRLMTQRDERLARAESDNAKLRELLRAAWRCIHTGASCSDCRLIAGGCTLQSAMRELGLEEE